MGYLGRATPLGGDSEGSMRTLLFAPLLAYIARIGDQYPGRSVAVVVPEMVARRWYHWLLRTHRAATSISC